jgi:hypothetical protein
VSRGSTGDLQTAPQWENRGRPREARAEGVRDVEAKKQKSRRRVQPREARAEVVRDVEVKKQKSRRRVQPRDAREDLEVRDVEAKAQKTAAAWMLREGSRARRERPQLHEKQQKVGLLPEA